MKKEANREKTSLSLGKFDQAALDGNLTWWQMELPSGKVIFGKEKAIMLGYFPEDFKKYQDFTRLVHPDDYSVAMDAMNKHLTGKKEYYEVTYRIKNENGKYIKFFDIGKIVAKRKGITIIIGFVFKIDNGEQQKYYSNLVKNEGLTMSELILRIIK